MFIWKWWWKKKKMSLLIWLIHFDIWAKNFSDHIPEMLVHSIQNTQSTWYTYGNIFQIMLWNEFSIKKKGTKIVAFSLLDGKIMFIFSINIPTANDSRKISVRIECKKVEFSLWFNLRSWSWITHLLWDARYWRCVVKNLIIEERNIQNYRPECNKQIGQSMAGLVQATGIKFNILFYFKIYCWPFSYPPKCYCFFSRLPFHAAHALCLYFVCGINF